MFEPQSPHVHGAHPLPTCQEYIGARVAGRSTARALALWVLLVLTGGGVCHAEPAAHMAIAIDGLGEDETDALRTAMQGDLPACPAEIFQATQLADRLVRAATESRRSRGDYTPLITTDVDAGSAPDQACWTVAIKVQRGSGFVVRNLQLQFTGAGAADPLFVALRRAPPFAIGAKFTERAYEGYKSDLARSALENGYFDAGFLNHRVDVYQEQRVVDIDLGFDTGSRYAFGNVHITPRNLPLSDDFLRRIVPFRTGEPYSALLLNKYRERLLSAGYFASISVEPDVKNAVGNQVPIETTLESLPRTAVTAGIGFATDIGPRIKGSYEDRFLTPTGHQFEAQMSLSPVVSEASISYRLPSQAPAERWLAFDAGAKRERTATAHSDGVTAGVRSVVVFASDWRRTIALTQSYERFVVGTDRAHSLLLVPSVRFERTHRSAIGTFDLGWSANVVLSGARKMFLSDLSFVQIHAQGRFALPLGDRARVLLRGEAGSSYVAGFAELPPTYRFFAGGDDSVRGFDFKTLGPRGNGTDSANNDVRGGRNLITASVEYERLFAPRWSWAVFTDAGNAFNDFSGKLRYAAGVGVRWHSPVGSIRLDIAHAIDGGTGGVRIHFGIGQLQ